MRWFEVLAVVVTLVAVVLRELGHGVSWIFLVPAVALDTAVVYVRLVVDPPKRKRTSPR